MRSSTLTPVGDYLATSFQPDCEYIEGTILERNLGEKDHSNVQMALSAFLFNRRNALGIHVYPEQRIQVLPNRFRVPDICVVSGAEPAEQIFTAPPFICIEILSKDDRMEEMQERIDDYLSMGVPQVWLINPRTRKAYVYTSQGSHEAKDGILRAENPEIIVPLAEVFSAL